MNDHSNLFCSGNIYQNYRYRWNVDSIPPVFLYYDIFRNIATANFYFSFTAFSAVFGVPVSPLPSLPKVQGFRQILQAVYCLPVFGLDAVFTLCDTAVVLPPGLPCTVVALLSAVVGLVVGIRVMTGVAAGFFAISLVFTN